MFHKCSFLENSRKVIWKSLKSPYILQELACMNPERLPYITSSHDFCCLLFSLLIYLGIAYITNNMGIMIDMICEAHFSQERKNCENVVSRYFCPQRKG